ncbi:MFS transporter [Lindgomyces ingoldianus]|uniref:MFS transporter n=1 Tax=Lindgomyces ingoldianus TaxID=673940 RepID=A0ACB6QJS8_9PLEO|nr:MFS transporter [Lindgomyces ingoldianus]KAF2467160.1 MFS transporter [Lindgomyces ingoldianus]
MLNHLVVNSYNLWVVVFVGMGTISTAYGLAIICSTVGQPNFYSYFNLASAGEPGYNHTTNTIGALNGVNSAGAIFGCLLNAWTCDKYGRKRSIMIGCIVLVAGGALCSGAVDIAMFLIGRFIAGLGAGMLACAVPMYQAEVSTPETRGAMCVFPLAVLAGSNCIPFSPRWLLQQGHREEALEIVKKLHRTPKDPENIKAREEFCLIEKQYELDKAIPVRLLELFRTKANRKRALVGFLLMWGNQFLSIFVMTNYGVLIYASLGLSGFVPLLLNACWTTFTIVGNIWTAFYIDRFGRRAFMLIGSTGCTACVIFLCVLTAEYLNTTNIAGLRVAYVYIAEIFPNHFRPQGVAFGLSAFYVASEITLVGAPVALNAIGWKFYLVLICPSIVYIGLIYLLFPETKGRTLEEIGALFGDKHIASRWYDMSQEEKQRVAQEALAEMPESGEGDRGNGVKSETTREESV